MGSSIPPKPSKPHIYGRPYSKEWQAYKDAINQQKAEEKQALKQDLGERFDRLKALQGVKITQPPKNDEFIPAPKKRSPKPVETEPEVHPSPFKAIVDAEQKRAKEKWDIEARINRITTNKGKMDSPEYIQVKSPLEGGPIPEGKQYDYLRPKPKVGNFDSASPFSDLRIPKELETTGKDWLENVLKGISTKIER